VTGIIILVSLVWVAGVVVCVAIIYRAGIEEGIRRANAGGES
jgi:SNF family Na+-dependent transporter